MSVASLHIGHLSGNDLFYHIIITYFFTLFSDLKIHFITGRRKTFSLWASRLLTAATHQGSLLPILINLSHFYTMGILRLNLLIHSLTNQYVNDTTRKATGLKAGSLWDTTFQDVSNSLIPNSNWQPTTALPAHTQLLSQEFHKPSFFTYSTAIYNPNDKKTFKSFKITP